MIIESIDTHLIKSRLLIYMVIVKTSKVNTYLPGVMVTYRATGVRYASTHISLRALSGKVLRAESPRA